MAKKPAVKKLFPPEPLPVMFVPWRKALALANVEPASAKYKNCPCGARREEHGQITVNRSPVLLCPGDWIGDSGGGFVAVFTAERFPEACWALQEQSVRYGQVH